jgi:hypothetical protein
LDRFLTECACCQTRSVKGITKLEAQLKLTVITRISDVNALLRFSAATTISGFGYNNCDFKPAIDLGTKRFTIGKASKLEVLNAQVDLNTDQVALLRQKNCMLTVKFY